MIELSNGQAISLPQHKQHLPNGHQARYTAEIVLRTRPKTYRKAVQLLAGGGGGSFLSIPSALSERVKPGT